jgi:hypothetical protein
VANWHALTGSPDGNSFRIVYHVAIPATLNRAGISYQTALVNSGLGGKTTLPDGDGTSGTISAAEKTQVQAGSLYEYAEDFATNPGEAAAALQARVDARYTALVSLVQGWLAKQLTYFGYTH